MHALPRPCRCTAPHIHRAKRVNESADPTAPLWRRHGCLQSILKRNGNKMDANGCDACSVYFRVHASHITFLLPSPSPETRREDYLRATARGPVVEHASCRPTDSGSILTIHINIVYDDGGPGSQKPADDGPVARAETPVSFGNFSLKGSKRQIMVVM